MRQYANHIRRHIPCGRHIPQSPNLQRLPPRVCCLYDLDGCEHSIGPEHLLFHVLAIFYHYVCLQTVFSYYVQHYVCIIRYGSALLAL